MKHFSLKRFGILFVVFWGLTWLAQPRYSTFSDQIGRALAISIVIEAFIILLKNSKKPEPALQEDAEKKPIRGSGVYQIRNWAKKDDIFEALGTPEPIFDMTQEKYQSNPIYEWLLNTYRPNGHLYIGGTLFWDKQGHILTVGGNRSGKGSCLIVPALTNDFLADHNAPSFVVLDPKGENLAIAGKFLKTIGYNVLAINPFNIPEITEFGNARFNPFDLFSGSDPDFDKYADMIGFALIPSATHANDYFDKSARNYITLYIRHMMTQDEDPKNFRTLYKWLRLAGSERTALLMKMSKNDAFDGDIKDEAKAIFGQLVNDGGKTVESIYSTVRTATDVFKDMQLRESVSTSDIDLKTLAKEKTAIFVCLSPSDLSRCQVWLRLFFGSVMRALTKHYNPKRKVVLLMDEFPTMGALKEFEVGAGFLAGYNVTLWPVMQDLTQLKSLYPDTWETFVNNAVIKHYLSIGDNFTADYVSKRMPIIEEGYGDRRHRKPLLRPDEVLTEDSIIVEIKGLDKPALFIKSPYWEWLFKKNVAPNPFRS